MRYYLVLLMRMYVSLLEFPEFLSCRQVLNIMVILGFMLNYALRVNLTIAIVAMVEDPKGTSTHKTNLSAPLTINDTYSYKTHAKEELTSASHTLLTTATPEPFQNTTDKVSTSNFFPPSSLIKLIF